jgi:hypothetical protein
MHRRSPPFQKTAMTIDAMRHQYLLMLDHLTGPGGRPPWDAQVSVLPDWLGVRNVEQAPQVLALTWQILRELPSRERRHRDA